MLERIQRTIENLEKVDLATLKTVKTLMFFIIIIILVGVIWYLNLKKLGTALLMASIAVLGVIMILELRRKSDKEVEEYMTEECTKCNCAKCTCECHKTKEKDERTNLLGVDMGLPSAEEYQERVNKSFGI